MELEAAVQAAAAAAGAPVPHVLIASDSVETLGNPFLICNEIAGETIVRRIQRQLDDDGRAKLLRQCAQALAAIHRGAADAPGLAKQDDLVRMAAASRRNGRHHSDIRVGVPVADEAPAAAVTPAAGARGLPDGQPDRRRLGPGGRAGLGTGPHRRDL